MEWISAFILTVAFEAPVLVTFLPERGLRTILSVAFAVNLASHPILWFVLPSLFAPDNYVLFGEFTVILMEWMFLRLMLRDVSLARSLLASAAMNLFSFFLGAVLQVQGLL